MIKLCCSTFTYPNTSLPAGNATMVTFLELLGLEKSGIAQ